MTKLIVAAMIVSLLLAAIGTHKAEAHSGYWRNTGNSINLREGPGGQYAVIGTVPSWGVVLAYGHQGNWLKLKVLATGKVGWAWLWNFHASSYVPPSPAPAQPALQLCWDTAFNWVACAAPWIAQAIYEAARYYGVPFWAMMGIASCESAFRPWIVNPYSGVIGLYQFQPSTFYWMSPGANIWSVYDQAYTAAKMLARGMASHFDCAWRIGYS